MTAERRGAEPTTVGVRDLIVQRAHERDVIAIGHSEGARHMPGMERMPVGDKRVGVLDLRKLHRRRIQSSRQNVIDIVVLARMGALKRISGARTIWNGGRFGAASRTNHRRGYRTHVGTHVVLMAMPASRLNS